MDEKKELDELMELCNKEGVEIPDELLDSVAGGRSPEIDALVKRLLDQHPELAEEIPSLRQGQKIDPTQIMLYLLKQKG